jgi:hypothetical protein
MAQSKFKPIKFSKVTPRRRKIELMKADPAAIAIARSHGIVQNPHLNKLRFHERCKDWDTEKISHQVLEFANGHRKVAQRVGVGIIKSRSNPAWFEGTESYLAYSKGAQAAETVLGVYGGRVRRAVDLHEDKQPQELRGKTIDLSVSSDWTPEDVLVVDGNQTCNELAMCNDFRTNIRRYDDDSSQERAPNAEMIEVTLPGNTVPCVVIATTQPLRDHEEILLDYGSEYWAAIADETAVAAAAAQFPTPKRWPSVLHQYQQQYQRGAGAEVVAAQSRQMQSRRRQSRHGPPITELIGSSSSSSSSSSSAATTSGTVHSLTVYCSNNEHIGSADKDALAVVLGTVFCDQSWEKGSNAIREHLDQAGSFTLALCINGAVLAAAMVDHGGASSIAGVIRMMATHPNYRRHGCGRLLNALVHEACQSRKLRYVCVEVTKESRGKNGCQCPLQDGGGGGVEDSSRHAAEGQAIWRHFGYTAPRQGQLPQQLAPIFRDTCLLLMSTEPLEPDRAQVKHYTGRVKKELAASPDFAAAVADTAAPAAPAGPAAAAAAAASVAVTENGDQYQQQEQHHAGPPTDAAAASTRDTAIDLTGSDDNSSTGTGRRRGSGGDSDSGGGAACDSRDDRDSLLLPRLKVKQEAEEAPSATPSGSDGWAATLT